MRARFFLSITDIRYIDGRLQHNLVLVYTMKPTSIATFEPTNKRGNRIVPFCDSQGTNRSRQPSSLDNDVACVRRSAKHGCRSKLDRVMDQ